MATTKEVDIYNLKQLRVGDVVIAEDTDDEYPTVRREVKTEPFVPDPAVWRSTGSPNGASPILGRQNLDVFNPGAGSWTRYVRIEEDD